MARLIATVLITKHFQTVGLVHVIKFELRHGKDIVSYKLRGLEIFLVVKFKFGIGFHGIYEIQDWDIIGKTRD